MRQSNIQTTSQQTLSRASCADAKFVDMPHWLRFVARGGVLVHLPTAAGNLWVVLSRWELHLLPAAEASAHTCSHQEMAPDS